MPTKDAKRRLKWARTFIVGRTDRQLALYIVDGVQCGYANVLDAEAIITARAEKRNA